MLDAEAARDDGIDVVSIVVPNHLHYEIAKAFLGKGISVICDKPMTVTLDESKDLIRVADASGAAFVLTQNNTGYPMVRQARAMVADGTLGDIQVIRTSYVQDWLTTALDAEGQKQAAWRTDPAKAGAGGSIGDIGVHAFNLAAFVSGLDLDEVCADLRSYVPGRKLDDNANVLLRYKGGGRPARSGPARSRRATTTACPSASTAPRAGWNGLGRTTTTSSTPRSGSRPAASPVAGPARWTSPTPRPGCRRATPRATSRGSATCTPTRPR